MDSGDRGTAWRAAAITGLITSTFSTTVVSFVGNRIGSDPDLRFMEVGTVLLRHAAVELAPGWRGVAAGVLVHQFADFAWAMVFFGLLARWTYRIRPAVLLAVAPV